MDRTSPKSASSEHVETDSPTTVLSAPALSNPNLALLKSPVRENRAEFAATVQNILKFRTPAPSLPKKQQEYFEGKVELSTLKELRTGHPVSRYVIKNLIDAQAIKQNPLDCAELCIRWGECVLQEDVYNQYVQDSEDWQLAFMVNPPDAFALAWPKVGGSWPTFLRRLTYGPNQAKIGRKRLTVRHLANLLNISESGLYKSLTHGGLKVETFKALRGLMPVTEKEKRLMTQLYLEHEVGRSLLAFSHSDFIRCYDSGIHRRLIGWVIGNSRVTSAISNV